MGTTVVKLSLAAAIARQQELIDQSVAGKIVWLSREGPTGDELVVVYR